MGKSAGDTVIAPGDANIQVFTASSTWNRPNGVRAARVRVIGGGGGSGGVDGLGTGNANSGGGGGGGYAEQYILAANLLASETVTIGAAGAAGASAGGAGGSGGTSSFGGHCSATGGAGGAGSAATTGTAAAAGGLGGTGAGGDINVPGDDGGMGVVAAGVAVRSAYGGSTPLAGSVRPSNTVNVARAGNVYGGGAAGQFALTVDSAGAAGAPGIVIVESIF